MKKIIILVCAVGITAMLFFSVSTAFAGGVKPGNSIKKIEKSASKEQYAARKDLKKDERTATKERKSVVKRVNKLRKGL